MLKNFIKVICLYDINGNIKPLYVVYTNELIYKIKRIISKEAKNTFEGGESCIRYTCLFENNQKRDLFLDANKWYVEKVDSQA